MATKVRIARTPTPPRPPPPPGGGHPDPLHALGELREGEDGRPPMAGMERRKEKAAASTGRTPSQSAVTTVVPDREIPGARAMHWASPTRRATRHPIPGPGGDGGPTAS
jgi:hypothetical protein